MALFRRGSTWYVDIASPTGERIKKSTGTDQKELAQEYHDRLKSDLWKQSRLKERPQRTFEEAADRWLSTRENQANAKNNTAYLEWLLKHLGGKLLLVIDKDRIDALLHKKMKEKVSPQTVNHYMKTLRAILRGAWEWGWIESVPPFTMLEVPKKRLRFLSREEASRLIAELPNHLKPLVRFALATGLRQRNLLDLEWNQVNTGKRILWIHADQSKSGKTIRIPLSPEALSILEEVKGQHKTRVFTYHGRPMAYLGDAFERAVDRAGVKNFRFHDLRHTWASWHVQGGTPLAVLKELGGWESMEMVLRYGHLGEHHLKDWAANVPNTSQEEKEKDA